MVEQIAAFANHLPVRIRFGEGFVANLQDVLRSESVGRPFVVVDEVVQGLPQVAAALDAIEGDVTLAEDGR